MDRMQALLLTEYGCPTKLSVGLAAKPVPKANEVLVKVFASSVNDWDWGLIRGKPFYMRLLAGLWRPRLTIVGVDVAGVVVATGDLVTQFTLGDRVYGDLSASGFGAFAEFVCAPASALAIQPQHVSHIQAAALPHAGLLAWQAMQKISKITAGQGVLINGAGGGVGTLGIQIARALGVESVAGVDSTAKQAMLTAQGFDPVLDYQQQDFTAAGSQYDVIIDPKTHGSIFRYLKALKPKGTYVTVGGNLAGLLAILLLGPLIFRLTGKRLCILALEPNVGLAQLSALVDAGKLTPVIDGSYSLDTAPQAIEKFGAGKHFGKLIIAIQEEVNN